MAISIDGLITKGKNDSDWVSKTDWNQFYSYIQSNDAVIMGRKTMDAFGKDCPIADTFNIVLSNNKKLHKSGNNLAIMSATPKKVVEFAKSKSLNNLLLIGGSETNKQFLKAKLIDEIVLSAHPLIIGNGLHLFDDDPLDVPLELIDTKTINNELVQLKYKVVK